MINEKQSMEIDHFVQLITMNINHFTGKNMDI